MKTYTFLLTLVLSIGFLFTANAQETQQDGKILKATYVTTHLSDFSVDLIKSQVTDPALYFKIINMVSQYKSYHNLYKDIETGRSLFTLDTTIAIHGVNVTGTCQFTYQENNEFNGKEEFMGKDILFGGKANTLDWEITDIEDVIGNYKCKKAILKSNPEIFVWFTTEVSVNSGPYFFQGLPGLVVVVCDLYKTIKLETITYQRDNAEFEEEVRKVAMKSNTKAISVNEILVKKENFKQMILDDLK